MTSYTPSRIRKPPAKKKRGIDALNRIVENDLIRRLSDDEYREKIKDVYGGPKGALLATASMVSLHIPLVKRLIRTRRFDLRGMQSILDVGSGAGQIADPLLKYSDPSTLITCIDLSQRMLERARKRLRSRRPAFVAADLSCLPFADESFDGVTCGYVLEHVPDPRQGLSELARVLRTGGRMMLLATEDTFSGAWTSRLWCCRTYNRQELLKLCESLRLHWNKELWFSPLHRAMRAGGICVEIEKI
jgi:ubiquinone/menaquinone biosynthesis C-methylase UbiE